MKNRSCAGVSLNSLFDLEMCLIGASSNKRTSFFEFVCPLDRVTCVAHSHECPKDDEYLVCATGVTKVCADQSCLGDAQDCEGKYRAVGHMECLHSLTKPVGLHSHLGQISRDIDSNFWVKCFLQTTNAFAPARRRM